MKILKYIILILLLWGIPSFFAYDVSIGSKFSYLTFGLLCAYYFLNEKGKLSFPFLALGILYFIISGLVYVDDFEYYSFEFIKYIILIVAGKELIKNTSKNELFIFLVLGATSILIHALVYPDDYGRYSGFYLDPNGAGFVCILAYCLSFSITPNKLKIIGQFIVTLAGILTFSRTFIFLWLIISVLSVISNRKNSINFGLGIGALAILFSIASIIQLNTVRFSALENILNDNSSKSINVINKDTRIDTWSRYINDITERPIFGNGFKELSGINDSKQGVHNSYLMIFGESGIIPALLFVCIYLFMLFRSTFEFKQHTHKFLMSLALIVILMSTHNYFDNYLIIIISLWLYMSLTNKPHEDALEKDILNHDNVEPYHDLQK